MNTRKRVRWVPRGAELALAFLTGAASFALVAVAVAAADADVLVVVIAVVATAAVLALALGYLAAAALVGELAAYAGRRADVSEAARSELVDEQAALRRVATLVAREAAPAQVFAKVAEEAGRLLGVGDTTLFRYEADGTATILAEQGERDALPVGTRLALDGDSIASMVRRTGRPARIDDYANATGAIGARVRGMGFRSGAGAPIVVEGRTWGVMVAASRQAAALPAGTEARIEEFTELVATAISNMQARTDLAASRARIVAAADQERRRIVREVHDGAHMRLVHTVVALKLATQQLGAGDGPARDLVEEALHEAEHATAELRVLVHGMLPSALTRGGLRAGVEALAARMPVPVEIGVSVGRLPVAVEATAYVVVAEALTNVAKHARAQRAAVRAHIADGTLRLHVRDDGVGGARPDGSGLLGLQDRLAVLDGRLRVESPAHRGTLVTATIPLAG